MAKIIENPVGRRQIMISADDVISIVKEYQQICSQIKDYKKIYSTLKHQALYLPEDL